MESPLRAERKKRKWSQGYVGKQVGLSAPQISRIEADGVKSKYVSKILKLPAVFGYSITLEEICTGGNPTKDDSTEAV